jgi:hypothetical protein
MDFYTDYALHFARKVGLPRKLFIRQADTRFARNWCGQNCEITYILGKLAEKRR